MYQISVSDVQLRRVRVTHATLCSHLATLLQDHLQLPVHVDVQEGDAEGGDDPEQRGQEDDEELPAEGRGHFRWLVGPTVLIQLRNSAIGRTRATYYSLLD